VPASTSALARSHPLAAAARLVVLTLVAVLTLFATRDVTQLWWIVLLALAGLPALLAPQHRLVGPLSRVAEVVVLGLAASQVAAAATVGGHIGG
jgi:hypothetical protein